MPDGAMMNAKDAVSAHRAECFVTIDGKRYSMLMAKDFEGKARSTPKRSPGWAISSSATRLTRWSWPFP